MQKYVNQLLEMLQDAHKCRPAPRYLEDPEEMERLRDVIDVDTCQMMKNNHFKN